MIKVIVNCNNLTEQGTILYHKFMNQLKTLEHRKDVVIYDLASALRMSFFKPDLYITFGNDALQFMPIDCNYWMAVVEGEVDGRYKWNVDLFVTDSHIPLEISMLKSKNDLCAQAHYVLYMDDSSIEWDYLFSREKLVIMEEVKNDGLMSAYEVLLEYTCKYPEDRHALWLMDEYIKPRLSNYADIRTMQDLYTENVVLESMDLPEKYRVSYGMCLNFVYPLCVETQGPVSILDIGCNFGTGMMQYERDYAKMFSVYGCADIADNCLNKIQELLNHNNLDATKFRKILISDMKDYADIPDDSYDVVMCHQVFEHLDDYRPLLNEINRIAKRFVVIGVPFGGIQQNGISSHDHIGVFQHIRNISLEYIIEEYGISNPFLEYYDLDVLKPLGKSCGEALLAYRKDGKRVEVGDLINTVYQG